MGIEQIVKHRDNCQFYPWSQARSVTITKAVVFKKACKCCQTLCMVTDDWQTEAVSKNSEVLSKIEPFSQIFKSESVSLIT